MSVTYDEPVAVIKCPGCRREREVSARQRRRIENGIHGAQCFWCRTGTQKRCPDSQLRYWLQYAGVTIPRGVNPRAYVLEHGVPPLLVDLAAGMWPETQHL